MDLTPIFRVEFFLDAIINSTTPPEPIFRKEFYLAKIAGADVPIPSPVFREEYYLAKLCGEDVEIPGPIFRKEFWLAKKCGEDVTTPTPIFREEYWLEEWVNGSSPQYQTVTGRIVSFVTQRIAPLKIEATLEPIQDLHGQDAPYPPGGGANKVDASTLGHTGVGDDSGTIVANNRRLWSGLAPVSPSTDYCILVTGAVGSEAIGFNRVIYYDSDKNFISRTDRFKDNTSLVNQTSGIVTTPATAAYAVLDLRTAALTTDISAANVSQLMLAASSTVIPYSPYSNICPISGHSGAVVDVTGKNIFDKNNTFENGKYIDATGAIASNANYSYCSDYIPVKPSTDYVFSGDGIFGTANIYNTVVFYDSAKAFISRFVPSAALAPAQFTTPNNCAYIRFNAAANSDRDNNTIQLEQGTVASSYEPFGSSVTLTFGSTVYGGTLTVNEDGTGTVKARPYYASYNGEMLVGPWVSSMDAYAPGTTPTTGAQVVDMGGTETTISLTPGQVNALLGNNTVWVDDSDNISVTYQSN